MRRITSKDDIFSLATKTNFTKSTYGSCSNLQQFINKIKTIDEPLSYKQFKDLSFDDIYEVMSTAPIFKNPVNFIDNYDTFKKLKYKNSNYSTYFDDLIKIANETDNKINFSLNESNIKEQHDTMLLENLDKMKAKSIHVDDKFLILEKYLPKEFKIIKTGKELLFEGLQEPWSRPPARHERVDERGVLRYDDAVGDPWSLLPPREHPLRLLRVHRPRRHGQGVR
jgi:hypothetical protein